MHRQKNAFDEQEVVSPDAASGRRHRGPEYGGMNDNVQQETQRSTRMCSLRPLICRAEGGRILEPLAEAPFPLPAHQTGLADFPRPAFRTGFIVRPTVTTVRARAEDTAPPTLRRHGLGRTGLCLCAACGGSSSCGHRHVDRRLHTPRQGRHRRSRAHQPPRRRFNRIRTSGHAPLFPASTARRLSSRSVVRNLSPGPRPEMGRVHHL